MCGSGGGRKAREKCVSDHKAQIREYQIDHILDAKVAIGMSKIEVRCSWGKPDDIDKSITRQGTYETWWYEVGDLQLQMVSFDNKGFVDYIGT